jgi:hypothetical protein
MKILNNVIPTKRNAAGSPPGSQPVTHRAYPLRRWLLWALLASPAATAGLSAAEGGLLDASRIGWSNLSYRASKLFITVDADISIVPTSGAQLAQALMEPGEGQAIPPAAAAQTLKFQTAFFGRQSTTTLSLNSDTGAALQRTSHDSGSRYRHRIYRYTDIGAYNRTRWPVGKAEEKLPDDQWPQWSEAGEGMTAYPEAAVGSILTDPAGLLYIVGAAPLDKAGDLFVIYAYVRGHVHRVEIEVAGREQIKLSYEEHGKQVVKHKDKQEALKLLIRGEGLDDGDSEDEFELLGLRGDIVMHIDPRTRAPLQIEGRVKIAGHTKMRIRRLVLNDS